MRRLIFILSSCLIPFASLAQTADDAAFSLPLRDLKLTSSFGYRVHPLTGLRKLHCGIDLSARSDTLYSVLDGVVAQTGYDATLGIFIRVQHNGGIQTTYGHLRIPWVSATDSLSAGQAIGITGTSGRVTGEHLHFAVRLNGIAFDPLRFLLGLFRAPGQAN